MLTKQTRTSALILAAATALTAADRASAVPYYYGGYDTGASVAGTPSVPVSGSTTVAGQVTFYGDLAGTMPYAAGAGLLNSNTAELYLAGTSNYTASLPSATTAINVIVLAATAAGTNTLEFTHTGSNRLALATPTPAQTFGAGIQQQGSTNWNFTNPGSATAALRFSNSFTIGGAGSGNINIPFALSNVTNSVNATVNLTGGATLTLGGTNLFGGTTGQAFTLSNGTLDYTNNRAFGNAANQIRLNGGTLTSSTGTTIAAYTATAATTAGSILIGGNPTFAGATPFSLGSNTVTLTGSRTITANTAGATGTTIPGAIGESAAGFGLTVGPNSSGTLTLTGSNNYTGATVVRAGKLVLGAAAQTPVLVTTGAGADVQGGQLVLNYSGTSPIDTVRTALQASFTDTTTPGVIDSGQIRSTTATASKGLGYADDGAGNVTIKPALFGDITLDGGVLIGDFNIFAPNFGSPSGKVWTDGDFNYDGAVNIGDFNLLAINFGQSLPPSADWAPLIAFAAAHNDLTEFAALTGVPEPATLGLIAAGATLVLRRRRA